MAPLKIPVGISDFKKLRENACMQKNLREIMMKFSVMEFPSSRNGVW